MIDSCTMISIRIIILSTIFHVGCINGRGIRPRIFGGENAKIENHPYQVSLRRSGNHFCGGTIISERFILTAAHCVVLNPLSFGFKVHTGTSSLNETGNSHEVIGSIAHPDYQPGDQAGYRNDIALVVLKDSIKFSGNEQKINLPSRNLNVGAEVNLTGWGLISQNPNVFSKQLQVLRTKIAPNSDCDAKMSIPIRDEQLCTLNAKGIGACSGDSGGPLVANDEVVGIASWIDNDDGKGVKCAFESPEIYTNVYAYKDYIISVMNDKRLKPYLD